MKLFTIVIVPRAERELDAAKERGNAEEIDRELQEKFRLLARCPEMGARVQLSDGWSETDRFVVLSRCHRILYYRPDLERGVIRVIRFPNEKQRPLKKRERRR